MKGNQAARQFKMFQPIIKIGATLGPWPRVLKPTTILTRMYDITY